MAEHKGWIGVDLDGTLAYYDKWRGSNHIGDPIPAMRDRVVAWLKAGQEVRIFTARASHEACALNGDKIEDIEALIEGWCLEHLGVRLAVTCVKDMAMSQLWDDRAVQVIPNTGKRADGNK